MGFIKKHRYALLASLGIAFLFFFLRLSNLTKLPIFTDEAIYIRWAQIALQDPNWRFISLSDGKQPLFVWGVMILLKFFDDPLLAGRLVSVFGGVASTIGLFFLTNESFKKKRIAFFASLIYVCFPFAQVYDRMALYDSLSGAFTIWALYFSILLVRRLRLDIAFTLGISIGLGALNKSTNLFSLYLLPLTVILFDFSKKRRLNRFLKWSALALVAVIVSEGIYSILRLSGLYFMIGQKNALFIFPYSEWINHPFNFFLGNLQGMTHWLFEYLKIPYVALIIIAFRNLKLIKEKTLLFLFMILPFIALALFARILFPRFIFFMTLSLLPLVAYALDDTIELVLGFIKKRIKMQISKFAVSLLVLVVFLSYPLFVSWQFAFDPIHSKIAAPDNAQYVNHWTAGWGVNETVSFIKNEAESKKVFVGTEGTFGLMPFALEMYLDKNPNVKIKGYWPLETNLPDEVVEMSKKLTTYMVFYQPNNINPPNPDHLKLIFKKRAGNSIYYYRLYQVIGY